MMTEAETGVIRLQHRKLPGLLPTNKQKFRRGKERVFLRTLSKNIPCQHLELGYFFKTKSLVSYTCKLKIKYFAYKLPFCHEETNVFTY